MPETKRLTLLVVIVLLLAACAPAVNTSSGSTNPITPTASAVLATLTLPAKTEMPTVVPPATSNTAATGTAPLIASPTNTVTVSPTAAAAETVTFSPLKVYAVSTFEKAYLKFNDNGWPSVVVMPRRGHIYFALRCEGKIVQGAIKIPAGAGNMQVVSSACIGQSELMLVYPNIHSIEMSGYGEILDRQGFGVDGLTVLRRIFESKTESQMVVWLQKTK